MPRKKQMVLLAHVVFHLPKTWKSFLAVGGKKKIKKFRSTPSKWRRIRINCPKRLWKLFSVDCKAQPNLILKLVLL